MTSRDAFEHLRSTTDCPYAAKARLWFGPEWDTSADFDTNVRAIAIDLAEFCESYLDSRLHGYVVGVTSGTDAENTLPGTAHTFWRFLQALGDKNPHSPSTFRDIEDTEWQFDFAQVRMFLNVFSRCYGTDHSKHIDWDRGLLVFAQPEGAFDLCGIDPSRQDVKNEIRERFAANGRAYDGELVDRRIESHLYVFPERLGDPPVRFWLSSDSDL